MSWFDRYLAADPFDPASGRRIDDPIPEDPEGRTPPPHKPPMTRTLPPEGPPVTPPPALPAVLEGWDATKWNDPNKQNEKYTIGRILAKYPPTKAGLLQALPELQAAYPGLTFDGHDSIQIPGGMPVDVLRGASQGGTGWQWLVNDPSAQAGGNMGNLGVPPVAPNMGVGGGGVPGYSGGGGDAGGGGWTMPRGSDYQFAGVPGFQVGSSGGGGAFGVPQLPGGMGQPPGMPSQGGGQQLFGGSAGTGWQTSTSPINAAWQPPSGTSATGGQQLFGAGGGDGQFGTGMIPGGGGRDGDRPRATSTATSSTGYDRAPSYTPLAPFQTPDVPDAAPEWRGGAFDVGPGPERFTLPTGQAALDQDPGYQFRLQQGLGTLEQSAAARGLLRTGGTLKDIQDFGQRAASQEYQNAVDRALAAAGFNETARRGQLDLGLRANDQNNRYGLAGAQFNADQTQRNYDNRYTAANQRYAYANQQNMAGNAQAMTGYQTDVGRDLGLRGLNLTAAQNAARNALDSQQQQWLQIYMQNGQSFDQAYRILMANLQYPR